MRINTVRLSISVFLAGAALMILEITGSRILAPFVGSSIFVWTSLIGVILACLSLGYWLGGKNSDANPSISFYAALFLYAGLSIAFIGPLHYFVLFLLSRAFSDLRIAALIGSVVLFALPSVLLGMISPYAVKLAVMRDTAHLSGKSEEATPIGTTVGSLYAISTLGSILGTFVAGFFLIAYLGSVQVMSTLAIILTFTSFTVEPRNNLLIKLLTLAAIIALLLFQIHTQMELTESGLRDIDTLHQRVMLVDTKEPRKMRLMVTDPLGSQSAMYLDNPVELAASYEQAYKLAFHFKVPVTHALMLGGGAYSFAKFFVDRYPTSTLDVVEIDAKLTELAKQFFSLKVVPNLNIHHLDARIFIKHAAQESYDAIFVDVFSSTPSIPFHLTTLETVKDIYRILRPDGVALVNIISGIEGETGRFLRAEHATYNYVFPHVTLIPVEYPNDPITPQNIILIAFKNKEKPNFESSNPEYQNFLNQRWTKPLDNSLTKNNLILTDNFAPVEYLVHPALLKLQDKLHKSQSALPGLSNALTTREGQ